MFYYNIPSTWDAVRDCYRPNIETTIGYVGRDLTDNTFLIATSTEINGITPLTDSEMLSYCDIHGLIYEELQTWYVIAS